MIVLSQTDVESLLDTAALIDAVADAFVALAGGNASVPARVAAYAEHGFLGAMPGYVNGILEAKLVTLYPGNHARGIPSHQALIALFDAQTGTPLAVMDGTRVTAIRTAAASAVAVRALARADARILAVVGAGVQGRAHLEAVPLVRQFAEIRVASRDADRATALAAQTGAHAAASIEEAVRGADVVCLCTHSSTPVVDRTWISGGAHVSSVGASQDGGELDAATIDAGLLVVESPAAFQAPPAGCFELAGRDPATAVTLGEILAGARPGRTGEGQITVYKSMGHAIEDAAAADLVYRAALRAGAGVTVDV